MTWTQPGVNGSSGPRCGSSGSVLALALYVLEESGTTLIRHEAPERSIPGIMIAVAAVVVMPTLAQQRRIAAGIGSGAMHADSKQADFCAILGHSPGRVLNTFVG